MERWRLREDKHTHRFIMGVTLTRENHEVLATERAQILQIWTYQYEFYELSELR